MTVRFHFPFGQQPLQLPASGQRMRFYLDYNKQFYSPHPNIHMVISALQDIWTESALKIRSVRKGPMNAVQAEVKNQLQFVTECWTTYLGDNDIEEYLSKIAHRYAYDETSP